MQTHAYHLHRVPGTKTWHFFFEFLMLFFAVFLGFIAENVRERWIENIKERDYIISMINSLKTDTAKLSLTISRFDQNIIMHDSLRSMFYLIDKGFNQEINLNLAGLRGFKDFIYTDGTIQQLKNSGGFRLIENQRAIDSIMDYDAEVKYALLNQVELEGLLLKMHDFEYDFFNYRDIDKALLQGQTFDEMQNSKFNNIFSKDKIALDKYYNKIKYYNWLTIIVRGNMEQVKIKASRLIDFLQKEYGINSKTPSKFSLPNQLRRSLMPVSFYMGIGNAVFYKS